jgi:hypothetical protein
MNNDISIFKKDDDIVINTRIKFISKDILYYALPTLFFLRFNVILFLYVFSLTIITYSLFRLFAWMYYSEIVLNSNQKKLYVLKYRFNKLLEKEIVSNDFKNENLQFKKSERSGKVKYIICYKTFKEYELLVVNEKDFIKIKNLLN